MYSDIAFFLSNKNALLCSLPTADTNFTLDSVMVSFEKAATTMSEIKVFSISFTYHPLCDSCAGLYSCCYCTSCLIGAYFLAMEYLLGRGVQLSRLSRYHEFVKIKMIGLFI